MKMAADFKTAQPVEYYRKFLKEDIRPDGRELGEIRPTILNVGSITTADGSALVKLGNTTCICGIKAEFCTPKEDLPKCGIVVPNVDLPPLCSSRFKPGPPSEQAQVVTQLLADVINNAKSIDLESLCIVEAKLCWVLFCDIVCLDYDGNIVDACLVALVAALRNVLLPEVTIEEDSQLPVTSSDKTVSLSIHNTPVATTFAIFDESVLLADPTNEEESIATGEVTIVMTEDGRLQAVHKPGGSPLSPDQLQDCITRTQTRSEDVRRLIQDTIDSVER
ncbi:exosome complex component RRP43-like [Acanthaster planci]|uniref:Ribosomal RNA-processing protein 43 n=1 Tax=Acanthaster planci TaxID=133434 RepID=A0A8B7XGS1_ACAPL|nr:exosome complex component RRP43-like [Acanthaster planci]